MPMSGLARVLGVPLALACGAAVIYLMTRDRRRMVQRAERAVAALRDRIGLAPMDQAASELKYFRQYPHVGFPLRFAGGTVEGLRLEICYRPIVSRSRIGETMLGIRCAREFRVEAALSARDAVTAATYSLLGAANGIGAKALFGNYDAWGPAADVARLFTPEFQERMSAFPRRFDRVMVMNGGEVVFVWKDIESDANVVKEVFRLGAMLCEHAGSPAQKQHGG